MKGATFRHRLHLFFCGLLMGIADSVPGISGGTIAFIMGIYEELIDSIRSLNSQTFCYFLQLKYKKFFTEVKWQFLLCVILGIALSLLSTAQVIQGILNHETQRCFLYAGFLGLILASILFCTKQLSSWGIREISSLAIGAALAFGLTHSEIHLFKKDKGSYDVPIEASYLMEKTVDNVDMENMILLGVSSDQVAAMLSKRTIPPSAMVFDRNHEEYIPADQIERYQGQERIDIWLIICGMMAVSAMLLPGISGSYILHILGVYGIAIGALADFGLGIRTLSMDMDALWILTNLLIGIVFGALSFSRIAHLCLQNYREVTIAALIGFMIGSLRSIWPFWSYSYILNPLKVSKGPLLQPLNPIVPSSTDPHLWTALLIGATCFLLVYGLEVWSSKKATA